MVCYSNDHRDSNSGPKCTPVVTSTMVFDHITVASLCVCVSLYRFSVGVQQMQITVQRMKVLMNFYKDGCDLNRMF